MWDLQQRERCPYDFQRFAAFSTPLTPYISNFSKTKAFLDLEINQFNDEISFGQKKFYKLKEEYNTKKLFSIRVCQVLSELNSHVSETSLAERHKKIKSLEELKCTDFETFFNMKE